MTTHSSQTHFGKRLNGLEHSGAEGRYHEAILQQANAACVRKDRPWNHSYTIAYISLACIDNLHSTL